MLDKKSLSKPSESGFVDPVTFMKSRHPDLYSDSTTVQSIKLRQELLEYHLDTITNRNQEADFAHFARRLAQKEICPNLRPQTGPTGGGDSKVDSETIPVSSEVSELWVGNDPKAAEERWAFAFSAKKDWKAKVRSDVKSIASTKRLYKKIFFITNQFAPDKSRADSEDKLTNEYGIPVTILDRSWIVAAVFENGRADIAIEALGITQLKTLTEKKLGPSDVERLAEFEELERNLADPEFYQGAHYQLVEDSLRVALLARGLGRSRAEVDGYFIRAERAAKGLDSGKQRLRVAYHVAWTAIFWFDDYTTLNAVYDVVEEFALKSLYAEDMELTVNLWMVLHSQVRRGVLTSKAAKLDKRRDALIAALDVLVVDITQPNNALQAKTIRTLIDMREACNKNELDAIWPKFQMIVSKAEALGDYPFERFSRLITEMGEIGVESQEFDELFEAVLLAIEKRRSEVAGAELLRGHGIRKLEADKPYEAISLLGRAMERFIKREHRDDLIFCLMALSTAYADVGLLWAARSCALAAVERCFAYFREEGRLTRFSHSALMELLRVELRLGRVAHVLMCLELESALVPQLKFSNEQLDRVKQHREMHEAILAICFLSSTLDQAKIMDGLPEALEELGLFIPKGMLLYALGYSDELRNEEMSREDWSDADIDDFVKLAFEQPGRLQIPDHPQIEQGTGVSYRTNILGCDIMLEAKAEAYSISVAEAVLGAIEAFFATSLDERIIPYRQTARIAVEPSAKITQGLAVSVNDTQGDALICVMYPEVSPVMSPEARTANRDGLISVIAHVIGHIAIVDDLNKYIEKMGGEERAFARALIYSEAFLAQENVFGSEPKILIADWQPKIGTKHFPLKRDKVWSDGIIFNQIPLPDKDVKAQGTPKNAKEFLKVRSARSKHSDRKVASLIDIPLWNRAGWCATFYGNNPEWSEYPILGLAFKDQEAATKIFKGLQKVVSEHDKEDLLRVAILTGVDRKNPASYKVYITTNLSKEWLDEDVIMVSIGRINMMTPKTLENLDRFMTQIETSKRFLLVPIVMTVDGQPGDVRVDLGILKERLIVRPAWEVGFHDIDAPAFNPDDDPIIPEGKNDVPVMKLLEMIRDMAKERTQ